MTAPYPSFDQGQPIGAVGEQGDRPVSKLIKGAIWIAIGALIAAALVCVVWVLIGNQNGIIGKAFLTVLLLAAFAGVVLIDANLAHRRPDWYALASMITWVVVLLVGAVKIWMDEVPSWQSASSYDSAVDGIERFFHLILVVVILQAGLLHQRIFWKAQSRHDTTFTRVVAIVTSTFLVILVGMLVFFFTFPRSFDYGEFYWRVVVALAILAAVGTTLLPLLNALFAPKKPRPVQPVLARQYAAYTPQAYPYAQPQQQAWPTYYDGVTPLPVMPDGTPDWGAYYTGYPTYPAQQAAPTYPAPTALSPETSASHTPPPPAEAPAAHTPPEAPSARPGDDPGIPPRPPLPPVV